MCASQATRFQSVVVIATFFLLMTFNLDAQSKAQEEISRVVGPDRCVKFEDKHNLPYTCALIQEVMRWHPPTPLGAHLPTNASCR